MIMESMPERKGKKYVWAAGELSHSQWSPQLTLRGFSIYDDSLELSRDGGRGLSHILLGVRVITSQRSGAPARN